MAATLAALLAGCGADNGAGGGAGRLFLIGDSTVSDYPPGHSPISGWGQALRLRLAGRIEVRNFAVPGASSLSFYDSFWPEVRAALRPGDCLLIQFGHVDALPDAGRHTDPDVRYRETLLKFLGEAQARQVRPVLVTPIARYQYAAGKVLNPLVPYIEVVRQLARDNAVVLIDLAGLSAAAMERIGPVRSREWFMLAVDGRDTVHLTGPGAAAMAEMVERALAAAGVLAGPASRSDQVAHQAHPEFQAAAVPRRETG